MIPKVVVLGSVALALGVVVLARRAKAERVPFAAVPDDIRQLAIAMLAEPLGTRRRATAHDGSRWLLAVENHFRPFDSPEPGPKGRHKGVSALRFRN